MKTTDIIEETYFALSSNKARSGLTVLGIVIGISSVIVMLAIGQGAQTSIASSIQSLGSNMIMVSPGAQRGPGVQVSAGRGSAKSLKLDDATAIVNEVSSVKAVSPEVSGRQQVTAKGTNTNTSVVGAVPDYIVVHNLEVEDGNFISSQDVFSATKVAVIGPTVRDDLFGVDAGSVVGQIIRIKKMDYKIVGMTKAKGGTGFGSQDDMIYIPVSTAQRFLSGDEYVTGISVSAISPDTTTAVQQDITALLLDRHHITDPTLADFSTINQSDIVSSASSITGVLTMLLGSIAGISLVVGGIGIMNMMLTNVTERTKEIGLRKAIGAKAHDINVQFLIEAIALTFFGGVVGVALGWGISYGITAFGILQTTVSTKSIIMAFGVSALIGIVFGYYPARSAAKLNPINALRFE